MSNAPSQSADGSARDGKVRFFVLEGINSLGVMFFFNYLFFFLRQEFGLTARGSLAVAAAHGGLYMVMSHVAGGVAQRRGYLQTFRGGCIAVASFLLIGFAFRTSWMAQAVAIAGWTAGICFTWPALQGLVTEGESRRRTAGLVGIYNLVWSGLGAVSNFCGGAVYERFGSGGLFLWPVALAIGMAAAATVMMGRRTAPAAASGRAEPEEEPLHEADPETTRRFLLLARIANPFAYVAINTVVPMIPSIAAGLKLSPTESGLVNSCWFFARWGMFLLLWRWVGWHYRRGWMIAAYTGLVAGFLTLVLAPSVPVLMAGQVLFGASVGLIYYSSLFYSMDAGSDRSAHGGIHEAAIGLGTCVGPALAAVAITLVPGAPHAAVWAVGVLLLAGMAVVFPLAWKRSGSAG